MSARSHIAVSERHGSRARVVLGVVAALVSAACETRVSLGAPADAGVDAPEPPPPMPCVSGGIEQALTSLAPDLGEPRALAAGGTWAYVLLARTGASARVVRVPTSGGAAEIVTDIADEPVALAADGAAVYVATTSQITRIDVTSQATTSVSGQSGVSALAVAGGRAYWLSTEGGSVLAWSDFAGPGAPRVDRTQLARADARALAADRDGVFVAGPRWVAGTTTEGLGFRTIADVCDGASLALDSTTVYCVEKSSVLAVLRDGKGARALVSAVGALPDIAAGGGRIFFRMQAGKARPPVLSSIPSDGSGGVSAVSARSVDGAIATDRCALYFVTGHDVFRRPL